MTTTHETDVLQFLVAALQAVAPDLEGLHDVKAIVADLTEDQRQMVRRVLDGMIREHSRAASVR